MLYGQIDSKRISNIGQAMLSQLKESDAKKIAYLVMLYNERSWKLGTLEAHFIATYAYDYGYRLTYNPMGQEIFVKENLSKCLTRK